MWDRLGHIGALQLYQLFRQGSTLLSAVLLVKVGLSTEAIGNYEKLLYLSFVLSFFWTSGFIQGFLRLFPKLDEESQKRFFFNSYSIFLFISFSLAGCILLFPHQLLGLILQQDAVPFLLVYLAYFIINLPTLIIEYYFFLKGWTRSIFFLGSLGFGLQVILLLTPLLLGYSLWYSFAGWVVLAVCKHLILLGFLAKHAHWKMDWPLTFRWLRASWPLVLYALMGGATQAFDGWLVNYWYPGDSDAFAIFRYGSRELPLAIILTSALSNALIPGVSDNLKESYATIKQKSTLLMHILFPLTIVLMVSSKIWFPVLFSPAFEASIPLFNLLLLITISRLVFPQTLLIGLGKSQILLGIALVELLINVGLSILFIPWYGLWGIALGTLVAFSVEKILHILYLHIYLQIPFGQYTNRTWFYLYSGALVGVFLIWGG